MFPPPTPPRASPHLHPPKSIVFLSLSRKQSDIYFKNKIKTNQKKSQSTRNTFRHRDTHICTHRKSKFHKNIKAETIVYKQDL